MKLPHHPQPPSVTKLLMCLLYVCQSLSTWASTIFAPQHSFCLRIKSGRNMFQNTNVIGSRLPREPKARLPDHTVIASHRLRVPTSCTSAFNSHHIKKKPPPPTRGARSPVNIDSLGPVIAVVSPPSVLPRGSANGRSPVHPTSLDVASRPPNTIS
jgi:hypothetical protein